MKSSSLHLAKKHGIESPQAYRDSLIHDWYLEKGISERLEVYLLRALESDVLFKILTDGEITIGKKEYSVIWLDAPSKVRSAPSVLISLRYCPLLKAGYALVKILRGEDHSFEYLDTAVIKELIKE